MRRVAVVTGASSGIGKELARLHASKGGDVVIVARREEALNEVKTELEGEYGVTVTCVAMDLTDPSAPQRLFDQMMSAGVKVDYLINNAGFGGHGRFVDRDWGKDRAMIQLNVTALCELTRLFVPAMVKRGSGRVLNVASAAAFLPGPLQAVYYATKAFVVSFSQAVDEELRDAGANVTVTSLCPGAVATEFVASAGLDGNATWNNAKSAASVAATGYKGMLKGRLVVFNQWSIALLTRLVLPFMPRRLILKISRRSMEIPD